LENTESAFCPKPFASITKVCSRPAPRIVPIALE
jgi:hypothetical protein